MRYELITEIFNLCSRNQMRDVSVADVETNDPAACLAGICRGKAVQITEEAGKDGVRVFWVDDAGVRARYSFTPDE